MEETKIFDGAVFDVGTWLGRKQAFHLIAHRCSAADAECLSHIKDEGLCLAVDDTWDAFCTNRVGISRAQADKLIRLYKELGPDYCWLNSFKRISPADYRRIAFAVSDEGITYHGETIPLESEHAPQVVAAVDALRSELTPEAPPADPAVQAFAKAEKSLRAALAEFERLQGMKLDDEGRLKLVIAVEAGRDQLERIRMSTSL